MNIRERKTRWEEKRIANFALQLVRTDFWSMMGEVRLNSSMTRVHNDLQRKSMDWFLNDRDLRHKKVNALLLVCIHRGIFFDYDKIIYILAFKYPKRMHLIDSLREN